MGESIKKLLLMATTASFCALFAHLFILNTTARKVAFAFAVLNEIFHLVHYILVSKLKKRNIILGMIFYGICISCGLVDTVSNIVFFSQDHVEDSDRTAMKLCCIQASIIVILDAVCILIEFLLIREQRIRDGLAASSQKSLKPEKAADPGEDLQEKTPKPKTPMTDVKSDRKKKEEDSRKEVKKSERSRGDRSEKDRKDRDKSKSEKKDRDGTKSGKSEKKDAKSAKSSKDNSGKSKEKSHRKRSSKGEKGEDDRKKSDNEPRRKKSSKKSEKSHH